MYDKIAAAITGTADDDTMDEVARFFGITPPPDTYHEELNEALLEWPLEIYATVHRHPTYDMLRTVTVVLTVGGPRVELVFESSSYATEHKYDGHQHEETVLDRNTAQVFYDAWGLDFFGDDLR